MNHVASNTETRGSALSGIQNLAGLNKDENNVNDMPITTGGQALSASTKQLEKKLMVRHESAFLLAAVSAAGKMLTQHISYPALGRLQ
jgi:hypothetical protein